MKYQVLFQENEKQTFSISAMMIPFYGLNNLHSNVDLRDVLSDDKMLSRWE
jgi:hypothetical protein